MFNENKIRPFQITLLLAALVVQLIVFGDGLVAAYHHQTELQRQEWVYGELSCFHIQPTSKEFFKPFDRANPPYFYGNPSTFRHTLYITQRKVRTQLMRCMEMLMNYQPIRIFLPRKIPSSSSDERMS